MIRGLKKNKYSCAILFRPYPHFHLLSFILFLILVLSFFYNRLSDYLSSASNTSHYIFTFWEPIDAIPGYIRLCLKTWKKTLPQDYRIILLDYSNVGRYIGPELLSKILCKNMSLPVQADAIRVAILSKYGGIWMDADTVLINSSFFQLFTNYQLGVFGNPRKHYQNIGFIYASRKSRIIKAWLSGIVFNVKVYRFFAFLIEWFPTEYVQSQWKRVHSWNYLGNGILDNIVLSGSDTEFLCLDRESMFALPDQILMKGTAI